MIQTFDLGVRWDKDSKPIKIDVVNTKLFFNFTCHKIISNINEIGLINGITIKVTDNKYMTLTRLLPHEYGLKNVLSYSKYSEFKDRDYSLNSLIIESQLTDDAVAEFENHD